MRYHEKKKGIKKVILATAVLAVVAVLLLSVAGFFQIRQVTVIGNEYYTKEEIADFVIQDGYKRNSLYLYFQYHYMEQPEIPFIDTMEVTIDSPGSVTIRVYEKKYRGVCTVSGTDAVS